MSAFSNKWDYPGNGAYRLILITKKNKNKWDYGLRKGNGRIKLINDGNNEKGYL